VRPLLCRRSRAARSGSAARKRFGSSCSGRRSPATWLAGTPAAFALRTHRVLPRPQRPCAGPARPEQSRSTARCPRSRRISTSHRIAGSTLLFFSSRATCSGTETGFSFTYACSPAPRCRPHAGPASGILSRSNSPINSQVRGAFGFIRARARIADCGRGSDGSVGRCKALPRRGVIPAPTAGCTFTRTGK
jgi:hypothetical protein